MLLVGWLLNASWVMRARCTAGVPQVIGGVLGYVHKVSGEFVGTPSVQWFRQSTRSGEARFVAIAEATDLSYMPTADDVGARLRVECTGPYGGTTVHVDTAPLALDRTSHAELETILRRGQAEFHASTPLQESRSLLVTRKNIKVRSKSSRLGSSSNTLYKQTYESPLTVSVVDDSQHELELKLGSIKFHFVLETQQKRDLAVLCIRMFAGPNCPQHETEADTADAFEEDFIDNESELHPGRMPPPVSQLAEQLGAMEPLPADGAMPGEQDARAEAEGMKNVHWSDDEEPEEFRPVMQVSIRKKEDAIVADSSTLKNFSLGLAPPKSASRSRRGSATHLTGAASTVGPIGSVGSVGSVGSIALSADAFSLAALPASGEQAQPSATSETAVAVASAPSQLPADAFSLAALPASGEQAQPSATSETAAAVASAPFEPAALALEEPSAGGAAASFSLGSALVGGGSQRVRAAWECCGRRERRGSDRACCSCRAGISAGCTSFANYCRK